MSTGLQRGAPRLPPLHGQGTLGLVTSAPARPTMQDVARAADVSVKTVSRVVNDEPGVRAATRERVEAAVSRLGFVKDDGASQLRRGRSTAVGLVVEDLADPFYSTLARAVERVSRQHGYLLMTGSGEGFPERERMLAGAFLARRVAGLLVVPTDSDHSWLEDTLVGDTRLVFMDRPPAGIEADTFLSDNEGGVRSAVEHLSAHGHRRIGYLGDDPSFWTAARRLEGFTTAMDAIGLAPDRVRMGPHEPGPLTAVLREWTTGEDPVTAVVTGNNRVTVATLRAMRDAGVSLGLVGFDDFELADLLVPRVTVVAQDPALLGERAADLLFQRIAGEPGPPRRVVLPTRLVVRESGARR
jgi:LacI family transcriptional regulator